MMSRVSCHKLYWSLALCATLAACDGSRAGLLGEYVSAIAPAQTAASDAGAPVDPQAPADAAAASADVDASASVPSAPAAGSTAPTMTTMTTMTTTPPTITPPETQPTRSPDYVAVALQALGPLPVKTEQYVCAGTDLTLDEDAWVTAIEVVPQHADYTFRATVNFSEAKTCDALGVTSHNVFDYTPTNRRLELRDGDAFLLPASAGITVQLHYSGISATAPSTDTQLTEVRLWTLPKGERPLHEVVRAMYHTFNISIPIGAVDYKTSTSAEIDAKFTRPGAEVIGIGPALHFLGQRVISTLVAPDGTESTILDLQDWSVDARKDYLLDPSAYIPVPSGSTYKQSCFYSNRPEDQPRDASGALMTPQVATFGEDTRNEQCRMNVMFRYPL